MAASTYINPLTVGFPGGVYHGPKVGLNILLATMHENTHYRLRNFIKVFLFTQHQPQDYY